MADDRGYLWYGVCILSTFSACFASVSTIDVSTLLKRHVQMICFSLNPSESCMMAPNVVFTPQRMASSRISLARPAQPLGESTSDVVLRA